MGNWRNRPSRRIFCQQRSPPTSTTFKLLFLDGKPLWEKKFCTSIGSVPWQKIVDSKKFMYCHSNVLNWNDSAAEEAFQYAEQQYQAKINSLPCDISFSDPDTYVDQIGNPYIDPELVKELDREYFAPPDEGERNVTKNKRTKNSVNGENSWECDDTELNSALENKVQGWNQREWDNQVDDPGNVDNADNPWECSITHENGGITGNALEGGGVKLWGWNYHNNHSRDWGCGYNPWENDCLGIRSPKDKGWGKVRDNSWNQKQSSNLFNIDKPWGCKFNQHNRATSGRGWRNCEENNEGWKKQKNANASGDSQFRRKCGGWNDWNQSFQKRENSRHSLAYNSSRFQRDDHQTGHYWRREKTKRVSFAC